MAVDNGEEELLMMRARVYTLLLYNYRFRDTITFWNIQFSHLLALFPFPDFHEYLNAGENRRTNELLSSGSNPY